MRNPFDQKPRYWVRKKPGKCLSCGSSRVADLIFGLMPKPTGSLKERIEAGEVLLGGCCLPVMGEDPIWECADCGAEYVRAIGPGDPEFDLSRRRG